MKRLRAVLVVVTGGVCALLPAYALSVKRDQWRRERTRIERELGDERYWRARHLAGRKAAEALLAKIKGRSTPEQWRELTR